MTILHIDMDAFYVSVEELLDPRLKNKPVIVGGGEAPDGGPAAPPTRGVVAAASYAARRYGIRSAMPLATARRLCPHAIILRGHYDLYARFAGRIFQLLETWSPSVEPVSQDEAYVDLRGCPALREGSLLDAAARIRAAIRDAVGLNASVGAASNKLLAKIASDYAKPNGILWIAPGRERAFLAPLPAGRVPGVGPKTERRLRQLGVRTVGQLAAFPRRRLEQIFGACGAELHRKARGECASPVAGRGGPRSFGHETTFGRDTSDVRRIRSALSLLTEKAAARLRAAGLRAQTVTVKLRYWNFETTARACALPRPANEDHVLVREAARLLDGLLAPRVCARLVGVCLSSVSCDGARQLELFDPVAPEQWERLYRGIDRLRARHGFRAILRGSSYFEMP